MLRYRDRGRTTRALLGGVLLTGSAACESSGYGLEPIRHDTAVAYSAYTTELPPTTPPAKTAAPKPAPVAPAPTPPAASAPIPKPTASSKSATHGPCPTEMALVDGEYCTRTQQVCDRWVDEGSEFLPQLRCARFRPSKCIEDKSHKRFCIDIDEYTPPNDKLPGNYQSWTMASQTCGSLGKRLCTESEWNFACEGEEMLPYPYGYERNNTICNFDLTDLTNEKGKLKDWRKPSASLDKCTSPFGVRNMVGNIDEWVFREGGMLTPFRSALKGGWWMAARSRCRPATTAHDEYYKDTQTGFRCCKDARPATDR